MVLTDPLGTPVTPPPSFYPEAMFCDTGQTLRWPHDLYLLLFMSLCNPFPVSVGGTYDLHLINRTQQR